MASHKEEFASPPFRQNLIDVDRDLSQTPFCGQVGVSCVPVTLLFLMSERVSLLSSIARETILQYPFCAIAYIGQLPYNR